MPLRMQYSSVPMTTSGWVKSTTTSVNDSASASTESPWSIRATRVRSSAASTAWQTCEPIFPCAPSTATFVMAALCQPVTDPGPWR
jgi:hypothetical protein